VRDLERRAIPVLGQTGITVDQMPSKDHGREVRAYIRDPDGHLIEVGQTTARPSQLRQRI
jgi:catechol 2,3-dioxygenase-like lactoylglutathione lyase family enzyme